MCDFIMYIRTKFTRSSGKTNLFSTDLIRKKDYSILYLRGVKSNYTYELCIVSKKESILNIAFTEWLYKFEKDAWIAKACSPMNISESDQKMIKHNDNKYSIEDAHSLMTLVFPRFKIFNELDLLLPEIKKEIGLLLYLIEENRLFTLYEVFTSFDF